MKNNQSERKKSALPFRINKQSFLGVLSLIFQELIDRLLTKFHFRLPKEEEVLRRVRKNAIANDPSSVLKIIDKENEDNVDIRNIRVAMKLGGTVDD